MNKQLPIFGDGTSCDFPELTVSEDKNSKKYAKLLLKQAKLHHLIDKLEVWEIPYSSQKLSYATHNIFRFFGKFPPPIARHLIKKYTQEHDVVYDPMVGSGTTAIEALLLKRRVFCSDVSPLSDLLTRVKCQPIAHSDLTATFNVLSKQYFSKSFKSTIKEADIPLPSKSLHHFFLKDTIRNLLKIRSAILKIESNNLREFFLCCFISIIRKVSRATTQQGRLFLDKDTAVEDPWPEFEKATHKFMKSISMLPQNISAPHFIVSDLRGIHSLPEQPKLVICHPPYFNVYKFSRIFQLELAWLLVDKSDFLKNEVREFFKIGKPENVFKYVEDMKDGIVNISSLLKKGSIFALMIGDTLIHNKHIPTTSLLLELLDEFNLNLRSLAVRIPKYTEASWVASQRRTGQHIGVKLSDYIITFEVE